MSFFNFAIGKLRTKIIRIDPANPEPQKIAIAARVLRNGGLVAFPTETVYGLGADYLNERAVQRIYEVKKRPHDKLLTVHVADVSVLNDLGCNITPLALKMIAAFWPGPLTLIMRTKDKPSLGFRMPANKIALELIRESGGMVVAPSANLSGNPPPKNAKDVERELTGLIEIIIDGGPTEIGIESSVVDLTAKPCKVLREGALRDKLKVFLREEGILPQR